MGLRGWSKIKEQIKVAIIGASGSKLDEYERFGVMKELFKIVKRYTNPIIISGHSPRGGVDIIVELFAKEFNLLNNIIPAQVSQWLDKDGKMGYKSRNLVIASECDVLYCITTRLKKKSCYHCKTGDHEVTGACYTMQLAKKQGKETHLIVLH